MLNPADFRPVPMKIVMADDHYALFVQTTIGEVHKVAQVPRRGDMTPEDALRMAHMIAALPLLYTALSDLLEYLSPLGWSVEDDEGPLWNNATLAITTALGEPTPLHPTWLPFHDE